MDRIRRTIKYDGLIHLQCADGYLCGAGIEGSRLFLRSPAVSETGDTVCPFFHFSPNVFRVVPPRRSLMNFVSAFQKREGKSMDDNRNSNNNNNISSSHHFLGGVRQRQVGGGGGKAKKNKDLSRSAGGVGKKKTVEPSGGMNRNDGGGSGAGVSLLALEDAHSTLAQQEITYGLPFSLVHTASNLYVSVAYSQCSANDPDCVSIILVSPSAADSPSCEFIFVPRYKNHSEGDKVERDDELFIRLATKPLFLHSSFPQELAEADLSRADLEVLDRTFRLGSRLKLFKIPPSEVMGGTAAAAAAASGIGRSVGFRHSSIQRGIGMGRGVRRSISSMIIYKGGAGDGVPYNMSGGGLFGRRGRIHGVLTGGETMYGKRKGKGKRGGGGVRYGKHNFLFDYLFQKEEVEEEEQVREAKKRGWRRRGGGGGGSLSDCSPDVFSSVTVATPAAAAEEGEDGFGTSMTMFSMSHSVVPLPPTSGIVLETLTREYLDEVNGCEDGGVAFIVHRYDEGIDKAIQQQQQQQQGGGSGGRGGGRGGGGASGAASVSALTHRIIHCGVPIGLFHRERGSFCTTSATLPRVYHSHAADLMDSTDEPPRLRHRRPRMGAIFPQFGAGGGGGGMTAGRRGGISDAAGGAGGGIRDGGFTTAIPSTNTNAATSSSSMERGRESTSLTRVGESKLEDPVEMMGGSPGAPGGRGSSGSSSDGGEEGCRREKMRKESPSVSTPPLNLFFESPREEFVQGENEEAKKRNESQKNENICTVCDRASIEGDGTHGKEGKAEEKEEEGEETATKTKVHAETSKDGEERTERGRRTVRKEDEEGREDDAREVEKEVVLKTERAVCTSSTSPLPSSSSLDDENNGVLAWPHVPPLASSSSLSELPFSDLHSRASPSLPQLSPGMSFTAETGIQHGDNRSRSRNSRGLGGTPLPTRPPAGVGPSRAYDRTKRPGPGGSCDSSTTSAVGGGVDGGGGGGGGGWGWGGKTKRGSPSTRTMSESGEEEEDEVVKHVRHQRWISGTIYCGDGNYLPFPVFASFSKPKNTSFSTIGGEGKKRWRRKTRKAEEEEGCDGGERVGVRRGSRSGGGGDGGGGGTTMKSSIYDNHEMRDEEDDDEEGEDSDREVEAEGEGEDEEEEEEEGSESTIGEGCGIHGLWMVESEDPSRGGPIKVSPMGGGGPGGGGVVTYRIKHVYTGLYLAVCGTAVDDWLGGGDGDEEEGEGEESVEIEGERGRRRRGFLDGGRLSVSHAPERENLEFLTATTPIAKSRKDREEMKKLEKYESLIKRMEEEREKRKRKKKRKKRSKKTKSDDDDDDRKSRRRREKRRRRRMKRKNGREEEEKEKKEGEWRDPLPNKRRRSCSSSSTSTSSTTSTSCSSTSSSRTDSSYSSHSRSSSERKWRRKKKVLADIEAETETLRPSDGVHHSHPAFLSHAPPPPPPPPPPPVSPPPSVISTTVVGETAASSCSFSSPSSPFLSQQPHLRSQFGGGAAETTEVGIDGEEKKDLFGSPTTSRLNSGHTSPLLPHPSRRLSTEVSGVSPLLHLPPTTSLSTSFPSFSGPSRTAHYHSGDSDLHHPQYHLRSHSAVSTPTSSPNFSPFLNDHLRSQQQQHRSGVGWRVGVGGDSDLFPRDRVRNATLPPLPLPVEHTMMRKGKEKDGEGEERGEEGKNRKDEHHPEEAAATGRRAGGGLGMTVEDLRRSPYPSQGYGESTTRFSRRRAFREASLCLIMEPRSRKDLLRTKFTFERVSPREASSTLFLMELESVAIRNTLLGMYMATDHGIPGPNIRLQLQWRPRPSDTIVATTVPNPIQKSALFIRQQCIWLSRYREQFQAAALDHLRDHTTLHRAVMEGQQKQPPGGPGGDAFSSKRRSARVEAFLREEEKYDARIDQESKTLYRDTSHYGAGAENDLDVLLWDSHQKNEVGMIMSSSSSASSSTSSIAKKKKKQKMQMMETKNKKRSATSTCPTGTLHPTTVVKEGGGGRGGSRNSNRIMVSGLSPLRGEGEGKRHPPFHKKLLHQDGEGEETHVGYHEGNEGGDGGTKNETNTREEEKEEGEGEEEDNDDEDHEEDSEEEEDEKFTHLHPRYRALKHTIRLCQRSLSALICFCMNPPHSSNLYSSSHTTTTSSGGGSSSSSLPGNGGWSSSLHLDGSANLNSRGANTTYPTSAGGATTNSTGAGIAATSSLFSSNVHPLTSEGLPNPQHQRMLFDVSLYRLVFDVLLTPFCLLRPTYAQLLLLQNPRDVEDLCRYEGTALFQTIFQRQSTDKIWWEGGEGGREERRQREGCGYPPPDYDYGSNNSTTFPTALGGGSGFGSAAGNGGTTMRTTSTTTTTTTTTAAAAAAAFSRKRYPTDSYTISSPNPSCPTSLVPPFSFMSSPCTSLNASSTFFTPYAASSPPPASVPVMPMRNSAGTSWQLPPLPLSNGLVPVAHLVHPIHAEIHLCCRLAVRLLRQMVLHDSALSQGWEVYLPYCLTLDGRRLHVVEMLEAMFSDNLRLTLPHIRMAVDHFISATKHIPRASYLKFLGAACSIGERGIRERQAFVCRKLLMEKDELLCHFVLAGGGAGEGENGGGGGDNNNKGDEEEENTRRRTRGLQLGPHCLGIPRFPRGRELYVLPVATAHLTSSPITTERTTPFAMLKKRRHDDHHLRRHRPLLPPPDLFNRKGSTATSPHSPAIEEKATPVGNVIGERAAGGGGVVLVVGDGGGSGCRHPSSGVGGRYGRTSSLRWSQHDDEGGGTRTASMTQIRTPQGSNASLIASRGGGGGGQPLSYIPTTSSPSSSPPLSFTKYFTSPASISPSPIPFMAFFTSYRDRKMIDFVNGQLRLMTRLCFPGCPPECLERVKALFPIEGLQMVLQSPWFACCYYSPTDSTRMMATRTPTSTSNGTTTKTRRGTCRNTPLSSSCLEPPRDNDDDDDDAYYGCSSCLEEDEMELDFISPLCPVFKRRKYLQKRGGSTTSFSPPPHNVGEYPPFSAHSACVHHHGGVSSNEDSAVPSRLYGKLVSEGGSKFTTTNTSSSLSSIFSPVLQTTTSFSSLLVHPTRAERTAALGGGGSAGMTSSSNPTTTSPPRMPFSIRRSAQNIESSTTTTTTMTGTMTSTTVLAEGATAPPSPHGGRGERAAAPGTVVEAAAHRPTATTTTTASSSSLPTSHPGGCSRLPRQPPHPSSSSSVGTMLGKSQRLDLLRAQLIRMAFLTYCWPYYSDPVIQLRIQTVLFGGSQRRRDARCPSCPAPSLASPWPPPHFPPPFSSPFPSSAPDHGGNRRRTAAASGGGGKGTGTGCGGGRRIPFSGVLDNNITIWLKRVALHILMEHSHLAHGYSKARYELLHTCVWVWLRLVECKQYTRGEGEKLLPVLLSLLDGSKDVRLNPQRFRWRSMRLGGQQQQKKRKQSHARKKEDEEKEEEERKRKGGMGGVRVFSSPTTTTTTALASSSAPFSPSHSSSSSSSHYCSPPRQRPPASALLTIFGNDRFNAGGGGNVSGRGTSGKGVRRRGDTFSTGGGGGEGGGIRRRRSHCIEEPSSPSFSTSEGRIPSYSSPSSPTTATFPTTPHAQWWWWRNGGGEKEDFSGSQRSKGGSRMDDPDDGGECSEDDEEEEEEDEEEEGEEKFKLSEVTLPLMLIRETVCKCLLGVLKNEIDSGADEITMFLYRHVYHMDEHPSFSFPDGFSNRSGSNGRGGGGEGRMVEKGEEVKGTHEEAGGGGPYREGQNGNRQSAMKREEDEEKKKKSAVATTTTPCTSFFSSSCFHDQERRERKRWTLRPSDATRITPRGRKVEKEGVKAGREEEQQHQHRFSTPTKTMMERRGGSSPSVDHHHRTRSRSIHQEDNLLRSSSNIVTSTTTTDEKDDDEDDPIHSTTTFPDYNRRSTKRFVEEMEKGKLWNVHREDYDLHHEKKTWKEDDDVGPLSPRADIKRRHKWGWGVPWWGQKKKTQRARDEEEEEERAERLSSARNLNTTTHSPYQEVSTKEQNPLQRNRDEEEGGVGRSCYHFPEWKAEEWKEERRGGGGGEDVEVRAVRRSRGWQEKPLKEGKGALPLLPFPASSFFFGEAPSTTIRDTVEVVIVDGNQPPPPPPQRQQQEEAEEEDDDDEKGGRWGNNTIKSKSRSSSNNSKKRRAIITTSTSREEGEMGSNILLLHSCSPPPPLHPRPSPCLPGKTRRTSPHGHTPPPPPPPQPPRPPPQYTPPPQAFQKELSHLSDFFRLPPETQLDLYLTAVEHRIHALFQPTRLVRLLLLVTRYERSPLTVQAMRLLVLFCVVRRAMAQKVVMVNALPCREVLHGFDSAHDLAVRVQQAYQLHSTFHPGVWEPVLEETTDALVELFPDPSLPRDFSSSSYRRTVSSHSKAELQHAPSTTRTSVAASSSSPVPHQHSHSRSHFSSSTPRHHSHHHSTSFSPSLPSSFASHYRQHSHPHPPDASQPHRTSSPPPPGSGGTFFASASSGGGAVAAPAASPPFSGRTPATSTSASASYPIVSAKAEVAVKPKYSCPSFPSSSSPYNDEYHPQPHLPPPETEAGLDVSSETERVFFSFYSSLSKSSASSSAAWGFGRARGDGGKKRGRGRLGERSDGGSPTRRSKKQSYFSQASTTAGARETAFEATSLPTIRTTMEKMSGVEGRKGCNENSSMNEEEDGQSVLWEMAPTAEEHQLDVKREEEEKVEEEEGDENGRGDGGWSRTVRRAKDPISLRSSADSSSFSSSTFSSSSSSSFSSSSFSSSSSSFFSSSSSSRSRHHRHHHADGSDAAAVTTTSSSSFSSRKRVTDLWSKLAAATHMLVVRNTIARRRRALGIFDNTERSTDLTIRADFLAHFKTHETLIRMLPSIPPSSNAFFLAIRFFYLFSLSESTARMLSPFIHTFLSLLHASRRTHSMCLHIIVHILHLMSDTNDFLSLPLLTAFVLEINRQLFTKLPDPNFVELVSSRIFLKSSVSVVHRRTMMILLREHETFHQLARPPAHPSPAEVSFTSALVHLLCNVCGGHISVFILARGILPVMQVGSIILRCLRLHKKPKKDVKEKNPQQLHQQRGSGLPPLLPPQHLFLRGLGGKTVSFKLVNPYMRALIAVYFMGMEDSEEDRRRRQMEWMNADIIWKIFAEVTSILQSITWELQQDYERLCTGRRRNLKEEGEDNHEDDEESEEAKPLTGISCFLLYRTFFSQTVPLVIVSFFLNCFDEYLYLEKMNRYATEQMDGSGGGGRDNNNSRSRGVVDSYYDDDDYDENDQEEDDDEVYDEEYGGEEEKEEEEEEDSTTTLSSTFFSCGIRQRTSKETEKAEKEKQRKRRKHEEEKEKGTRRGRRRCSHPTEFTFSHPTKSTRRKKGCQAMHEIVPALVFAMRKYGEILLRLHDALHLGVRDVVNIREVIGVLLPVVERTRGAIDDAPPHASLLADLCRWLAAQRRKIDEKKQESMTRRKRKESVEHLHCKKSNKKNLNKNSWWWGRRSPSKEKMREKGGGGEGEHTRRRTRGGSSGDAAGISPSHLSSLFSSFPFFNSPRQQKRGKETSSTNEWRSWIHPEEEEVEEDEEDEEDEENEEEEDTNARVEGGLFEVLLKEEFVSYTLQRKAATRHWRVSGIAGGGGGTTTMMTLATPTTSSPPSTFLLPGGREEAEAEKKRSKENHASTRVISPTSTRTTTKRKRKPKYSTYHALQRVQGYLQQLLRGDALIPPLMDDKEDYAAAPTTTTTTTGAGGSTTTVKTGMAARRPSVVPRIVNHFLLQGLENAVAQYCMERILISMRERLFTARTFIGLLNLFYNALHCALRHPHMVDEALSSSTPFFGFVSSQEGGGGLWEKHYVDDDGKRKGGRGQTTRRSLFPLHHAAAAATTIHHGRFSMREISHTISSFSNTITETLSVLGTVSGGEALLRSMEEDVNTDLTGEAFQELMRIKELQRVAAAASAAASASSSNFLNGKHRAPRYSTSSASYGPRLQRIFCDLGVMEVIITLCGVEDDVVALNALRVANAVLENGNRQVQQTLFAYFGSREEGFFQHLRHIIRKSIDFTQHMNSEHQYYLLKRGACGEGEGLEAQMGTPMSRNNHSGGAAVGNSLLMPMNLHLMEALQPREHGIEAISLDSLLNGVRTHGAPHRSSSLSSSSSFSPSSRSRSRSSRRRTSRSTSGGSKSRTSGRSRRSPYSTRPSPSPPRCRSRRYREEEEEERGSRAIIVRRKKRRRSGGEGEDARATERRILRRNEKVKRRDGKKDRRMVERGKASAAAEAEENLRRGWYGGGGGTTRRLGLMWELFRLLQLFCEGHNAELQNYIRSQYDNLHNANMIHESILLLQELSHFVTPATLPVITQGFELLAECCQGPCRANQEVMIDFGVGSIMVRLLRTARKIQLQYLWEEEAAAEAAKKVEEEEEEERKRRIEKRRKRERAAAAGAARALDSEEKTDYRRERRRSGGRSNSRARRRRMPWEEEEEVGGRGMAVMRREREETAGTRGGWWWWRWWGKKNSSLRRRKRKTTPLLLSFSSSSSPTAQVPPPTSSYNYPPSSALLLFSSSTSTWDSPSSYHAHRPPLNYRSQSPPSQLPNTFASNPTSGGTRAERRGRQRFPSPRRNTTSSSCRRRRRRRRSTRRRSQSGKPSIEENEEVDEDEEEEEEEEEEEKEEEKEEDEWVAKGISSSRRYAAPSDGRVKEEELGELRKSISTFALSLMEGRRDADFLARILLQFPLQAVQEEIYFSHFLEDRCRNPPPPPPPTKATAPSRQRRMRRRAAGNRTNSVRHRRRHHHHHLRHPHTRRENDEVEYGPEDCSEEEEEDYDGDDDDEGITSIRRGGKKRRKRRGEEVEDESEGEDRDGAGATHIGSSSFFSYFSSSSSTVPCSTTFFYSLQDDDALFQWLIFLKTVEPYVLGGEDAELIQEMLSSCGNLMRYMGSVEISHESDMECVYFRIPVLCTSLTQERKDLLLWQVDRTNRTTKLSDFLQKSDELIFSMEQLFAFREKMRERTRFRVPPSPPQLPPLPFLLSSLLHASSSSSDSSSSSAAAGFAEVVFFPVVGFILSPLLLLLHVLRCWRICGIKNGAKRAFNRYISPGVFSHRSSYYERVSMVLAVAVSTILTWGNAPSSLTPWQNERDGGGGRGNQPPSLSFQRNGLPSSTVGVGDTRKWKVEEDFLRWMHRRDVLVTLLCLGQTLACVGMLVLEIMVGYPIQLYSQYKAKQQFLQGEAKLNITMTEVKAGLTRKERLSTFFGSGMIALRVFLLLVAILSAFRSPYFAAFNLLLFVYKINTLRTFISAITMNGKQLMWISFLGVIILYLFSVTGFVAFPTQFNPDDTNNNNNHNNAGVDKDGKTIKGLVHTGESMEKNRVNEDNCATLLRCFVYIFSQGLRAGGGVGDVMERWSWGDRNLITRVYFDVFFYVLVNVVYLNILFGIIIDTFGQMRDERREKEADMHGKCFICGLDSDTLEKVRPNGFHAHVKEDHNMWMYLYFLHHLRRKDPSTYTGQESYVQGKIQAHRLSFFPNQSCIALLEMTPEEGRNEGGSSSDDEDDDNGDEE